MANYTEDITWPREDTRFGRVFKTAVVSLNVPESGLLQTSLSDLKMICVFTGKIK